MQSIRDRQAGNIENSPTLTLAVVISKLCVSYLRNFITNFVLQKRMVEHVKGQCRVILESIKNDEKFVNTYCILGQFTFDLIFRIKTSEQQQIRLLGFRGKFASRASTTTE